MKHTKKCFSIWKDKIDRQSKVVIRSKTYPGWVRIEECWNKFLVKEAQEVEIKMFDTFDKAAEYALQLLNQ